MKRLLSILIIGLVVLMCSALLYGNGEEVAKKVNLSICLGQEAGIVEVLAPDVVLVMQGVENHCTKQQAEQVLREFFKRNKTAQFISKVEHNHISGKLTTTEGKVFELEYVLRFVNNQEVITGFYIR